MTIRPTPCVVHIGAAKCGSSALQNWLSMNPAPTTDRLRIPGLDDRPYAYCSANGDGVAAGADLLLAAERSQLKYVQSDRDLALLPQQTLREIGDSLRGLYNGGRIPVISHEAYQGQFAKFTRARTFEHMGVAAHVVTYVRPPVPWLNSAWWQFGAWSGATLDEYVAKRLANARWAEAGERWAQVPGVTAVDVRLTPKDIVTDFVITEETAVRQRNAGLPGPLLRLIQATPELRPENEPEIDEVLRHWLGEEMQGRTPWVLDEELIQQILRETRDDAMRLFQLLRPADVVELARDHRWWISPRPHAVEPGYRPPTSDELLLAARALLRGLAAADREVRRLAGVLEAHGYSFN